MADQDPQSASNLIGMAVKMIYGLKLHLPSNRTVHYHTRHHHERIFWIAYIIDRDLSLITSEPYLLRDDEIGLNIKDIMCSEGTGNVRNDYYETIEILEPRAELAQIQGKLYDLVRSLKASKFSLTQKRSVEERLYRMLREWHKHLYEPRIDKNMYPGKPEELESRSHRLHEALLHLAYYRCLYSVANLSVSNRDWMQKLNDFSDRISLPVCEATVTVLAAHLITLPVRDLEETFPSDDDFIELKEMENDEYRLRGAIQHYGKFLHGIKDPQVLVHYNMFKELVSKAGQTVRIFFDNTTSEFWDARNNGHTEGADPEIKPSGIFMQQDFVTPEHEQKLVHIFENELEWPTRPGRLSLHYGYTFSYKTFGIDEETPFKPFPDWLVPLLPTTEGRPPDQVCLQQYAAGTGIPPHVDTHGPFDQLYSLSLGSALMMQFANKEKGEKIEVDLLPRSMMQMSGDSRLHWTHGIKSRKTDTLPDGTVRLRQLRWSLTYRWLRPGAECECGNEKLCDTAQRRNGVEREYRWKQEPCLQINSPVNDTAKVESLNPLSTLELSRRTHVRNPISHTLALCSVRHDIRVRSLVVPSLCSDTSLALLGIVRNKTDFSVGEVTGFTSADTGLGFGDTEATGELTCYASALGVLHAEAAAVAGDSDDNLCGIDTGLGDHGEGVESLGLVDVRAEAVTVGAARVDRGVTIV
ncbi:hypothetical protein HG531_004552 [Fusarium graminearum]|nr:hypothetical protein HG531_004552 [Fusarium graminearum]